MACPFDSVEEVDEDFNSWMNRHPNPTKKEIVHKVTEYVNYYFRCDKVKPKVAERLNHYVKKLKRMYEMKKEKGDMEKYILAGAGAAIGGLIGYIAAKR